VRYGRSLGEESNKKDRGWRLGDWGVWMWKKDNKSGVKNMKKVYSMK
jgi:hypothetical protein